MKRIYLICALLLVSVSAFAQSPEGRTPKTVVADVLAQMPAGDGERFDALMRDLASVGEEGVLQLAGMLNPPGQGSNAKVEYALSGLTHWVSKFGSEAQQTATSNAYIKALGRASDREVKAFIIRELQLIGGEDAVVALNSLLWEPELEEPAIEAIAAITGNALPRVAVNPRELAPFAARAAALSQKMAANPATATKLAQKALKDADRRYRFAALEMASDYDPNYGTLIRSLSKAKPEAKADILNWLGDECDIPGRRGKIAPLAGDAAIACLTSGDLDVTDAAAGLLAKTGGPKAIAALVGLLKSTDSSIVGIAADALASTPGDISSVVAPAVSASSDAGKIAAIKLLADRKSTENFIVVFKQLDGGSHEVRTAAYEALKDVVTATDLPKLYPLLNDPAPPRVAPLQQAIIAALSDLPSDRQYTEVMERMNAAPAGNQYVYYPILASTGKEEALELITERFDSESGLAKDSAFDALMSWEGAGAAEKLLAICKDPDCARYFDRALTRYTTIAADPSLSGGTRAVMLIDALKIARTDAQRRTMLNSMASANSRMAMSVAGDYLDSEVNNIRQAAANAVMTIALANPDFTGDDVRALLNKVSGILDNADADYQRKAIQQHLDAMPDDKPFELPDEEKREGFKVLFDGTNLDAWTGNKADYRVQGGTITLYPSRGSGGNLYTAREYGNFIYRFEFMLTPGANNGVGIRTPQGVDAAYQGMEIQILDHDDPAYRDITTHQVHGSVYGVIGAKRALLKPEGQWNTEEIYANGDHIRVTLNGEVILDGNIREAAKGGTFDGREHPGLFNKKGYIGFLGHGSQLKFRNIRIKELP